MIGATGSGSVLAGTPLTTHCMPHSLPHAQYTTWNSIWKGIDNCPRKKRQDILLLSVEPEPSISVINHGGYVNAGLENVDNMSETQANEPTELVLPEP
ncbi:unnamed protein product, partial [Sphenostylis stenocarpa]